MALAEAIDELKVELEKGADVDAVLAEIAEENGLKAVFLRNRALASIGPFETYAERAAAVREADRENQENARRKLTLARIRERIDAHNSGEKRVTVSELEELVTMANAVGGNYVVNVRGQKRAPVKDPFTDEKFLFLLDKFFKKSLGQI